MLTTQGKIVRSEDGHLAMQADCLESCKTCGVNKICSGSRRTQLLSLPATQQIWKEGQQIRADIEEGELLRIALLVYSLPCVFMLMAALLASPWGNLATAAGCLAGLASGQVISSLIALRKPPQVQLTLQQGHPDQPTNPLAYNPELLEKDYEPMR
ncbi:SoxR reducing system RseC family protein [Nitrincola iocasae]|uniref:SoxR reducing system RseC family protein n=1 Tax=Nitrincola iocasae TaxID=2614693 RepID=A0A5J6L955_9GAMM|nr:SoxR reducing system RseC family protein [Nitrincola iocasae]QEW05045.1 SoxR reducing system RseC family protein [Nitrincola iocasae]